MKGFRAYLQSLDASELDPQLAGVDLSAFHYGEWLLERGYDFKEKRNSSPLFGDYYRYQCRAIKTHFKELADYIREYGRQQGREVLVSGNFFNLDPHYLPLADDVDLLITEMRNTTYRQPEWYRYVAGFAGDKDVVVVENPYGGVVPELVEELKVGRGHDLLRLSLFEGAAMGANMTVPYGAWMGSRIEDSFWAPHELAAEIQTFLADHDDLFSRESCNEVGVVFSIESNRALIARQDAADNISNARDESVEVPYRVATAAFANAAVPFDVVLFADGVTAEDRVDPLALRRYRTLLLPSCSFLTVAQAKALLEYLEHGGRLVVTGELGLNLPADVRESLTAHPGTFRAEHADVDGMLPGGRQVRSEQLAGVAVNIHRLADGSAAVHLVNYDYDGDRDEVVPRRNVRLSVALPGSPASATAYFHDGRTTDLPVSVEDGHCRVDLAELPLYSVVVFSDGTRAGTAGASRDEERS
jgi:hypothetical protein